MKRKINLSDVFAAEQNQYHALYQMKQDIDYWHFDFAMSDQFEYLYWKDVFEELYEQYKVEYLDFKNHATGERMNNKQREKIYQLVMASGLQDVLFYKIKNAKGKEVVMDRFENFEAFVWNVEQDEREACAKVCEDASEPDGADLAERIRTRGQA